MGEFLYLLSLPKIFASVGEGSVAVLSFFIHINLDTEISYAYIEKEFSKIFLF